MNLGFLMLMNSPRLLIFPTAIKGVLITGVKEVDPGVIGTVTCTSYLCLCWRKPK